MSIQNILSSKIPDYAEIEIFFFEQCDLRCVHCFQDHDSILGQDEFTIMSKVDLVEEFFKKTPKTIVIMNIMGGELFQDKLLDNFLPIYTKFINSINQLASKYNKIPKFNFITNLLTTNHDLFKSWLQSHQLKLSVSYDLSGRFNLNQLLQFKHNIEIYKDYIEMIGLVSTKHNIDLLMKGKDRYFNYLYDNFNCYWDQLTPGPTVPAELVPSEMQYLQFLKFLIDHYPKCTNLEAFVNKREHNKMSCPSINKLLIEADNNTSSCRIQKHKASNDFITIINNTNDDIIEKWIDDKDCLSCEYFQRCPFSCFVRNDWKRLVRDFEGCIYKETFRHVDKKNGFNN
jgi:sulfatase maturation enzyme AslB (radical SAM superfamily)